MNVFLEWVEANFGGGNPEFSLVGPEPEWNYNFEVDGIVYNRYSDLAHAGQQDICAIRRDNHIESICEVCNPSTPLPTPLPDAYRWIPNLAAKREAELGASLLT